MSCLKDCPDKRQRLKGDLATILGELDELCVDDAKAFVKWTCKKAKLYKKAMLSIPFSDLPIDMQRGDIVLCDLGINIPPEFSDMETGKHFVVFWAQQGHNAIVIPITQKAPPEKNRFTISVGQISGLPSQQNYIKLDSLRSVSLYRLSRILGKANGKLHSERVVEEIKKNFEILFVLG